MRHIYLLITLLLGFLAGSVTYAEQPRVEPAELSREYQIKAAMLYKIAWFVRWKTQSFADTDSSINLCLSEPEPFGLFLDQVIDGRLFGKNKRPLSIIRLDEDNYHNKLVGLSPAFCSERISVTCSIAIRITGGLRKASPLLQAILILTS